jgi:endoglucanase
MKKESLDFLKKLVSCHSPSGYEKETAQLVKRRAAAYSDVFVDVHGNVISSIKKKGSPRVMLAGHIDEIGYMIKYIDDNGFLYFAPIGGVDRHLVPGQRVIIKGKKGDVFGVMGRKPIHLQDASEREKISKIENMWIDIGAKNKKEALTKVSTGDPAIPAVGFEILSGSRVAGRGFDDKAGVFVINECIRTLSRKKISPSVFGVSTVQEELGLRGARTSAYGIDPDIGIAVDVTFAADVPGIDKRRIGDVELGKGPVIARGPNINSKVFDRLVSVAKKSGIPHQVEGISRGTGTDANIIQMTRSGVATGLISIPNRYMHSPVEIVDTKDLENAVKLITGFIVSLTAKTSFIPY